MIIIFESINPRKACPRPRWPLFSEPDTHANAAASHYRQRPNRFASRRMIECNSLFSSVKSSQHESEQPRRHNKDHHPYNSSSWPSEYESESIKSLHQSLRSTLRIESTPPATSIIHRSVSATEFLLSSSHKLLMLESIGIAPTPTDPTPPLLCLDGGTTPNPLAIPGPIADSVNKRSTLSCLIRQHKSIQTQKEVAKKWLGRSLARGKPFTLTQTSTPSDPTASSWTLLKRLPPGPSRLCLNSPGRASSLSLDIEDLPDWAIGLVRINQSPRASLDSETLSSSQYDPRAPRSWLQAHRVNSVEKEKVRGGSSALRALMDEALP